MPRGQTEVEIWSYRRAGAVVVIALLVLISSGCDGMNPSLPACSGPDQPPCHGLSIDPGRFDGPGLFEMKIIVINATLTGPITCDMGVTISPSGSPSLLPGNQQVTPALITIPPGLAEGTVTCKAVTSAGVLPFTIGVGPRPPKGPPPRSPLTVLQWAIKKDDERVWIEGEAQNTSGHKLSYCEIWAHFYNTDGVRIGESGDILRGLEADEIRAFEINCPGCFKRCEQAHSVSFEFRGCR